MVDEVVKILRLVEKGAITKEQGYILIKAHYEHTKQEDFSFEGYDNAALTAEDEEAIGNTAELIEEYIDALSGEGATPEEHTEFEKRIETLVKSSIDDAKGRIEESPDNDDDEDNFIKKDYYLAGEKVYEQRHVSLKSMRKGKKYKGNFLLYEIMDSDGECIADKRLRKAVLGLIAEHFCGRYRRIKDGSVLKIYIE